MDAMQFYINGFIACKAMVVELYTTRSSHQAEAILSPCDLDHPTLVDFEDEVEGEEEGEVAYPPADQIRDA